MEDNLKKNTDQKKKQPREKTTRNELVYAYSLLNPVESCIATHSLTVPPHREMVELARKHDA